MKTCDDIRPCGYNIIYVCVINFLKFKYYRSIIFTQQNKAHWASGQDVALSRRKQGFDSPMGHQKADNLCYLFFYLNRNIRGIEPERVLPLRKQCSTLFSDKRAERTKRGRIVCKAKPQQTEIPLWVTKKLSF